MLPVNSRPSPPGNSIPDSSHRPTLLLVEDSPDDAFFFRRTLAKTEIPCTLRHVTDGSAAIEVLREAAVKGQMPDLVFLDLKMPITNGFEVLEWIQQQSWADSVRVTVLSGSNQTVDRERATKLGAFGYLVKPVAKKELIEFLEKLVS